MQSIILIAVLFFSCTSCLWAFRTPFTSSITFRNPHSETALKNFDAANLVDASYNLAAGSAVVGTICGVLENYKGATARLFGAGAILFTLFGGFVAYQTATLRFQFDETSFSLVKSDGKSIGDNVVVGGENSWRYDTFVNWDFLPSEQFPILVYFKETQTPVANRVDAPIVVDTLEGQAHFFPAIANVRSLRENFEKHECAKAESGAIKFVADTPVVL